MDYDLMQHAVEVVPGLILGSLRSLREILRDAFTRLLFLSYRKKQGAAAWLRLALSV